MTCSSSSRHEAHRRRLRQPPALTSPTPLNCQLFQEVTRIPSGIWSRLYGWIVTTWLLSICHPRSGSFPSALNTWSKVWPWILISACLIWNFEPIFGQQISTLDPPPLHWTFWSVLVWTFTLWVNCGSGSIGPPTFFCHGRTETWLLKSRLAACERRD